MVINSQVIPKETCSYWSNNTPTDEATLFLIIAFLHKQSKISYERAKAMFNSLRKGTLNRKINVYHSPITDKWYDNTGMLSILVETFSEIGSPDFLHEEEWLKYTNLYLNKNKNFCIDWIYFEIIEPIINRNYDLDILKTFDVDVKGGFISYEEADNQGRLDSGYCCRDCDGCLGEYKRSQYETYYKVSDTHLRKAFKDYLFSIKTPSALKNPKERLKT